MSTPVYFPGYLSSCIKSVSYTPMDKLPDEFKQKFNLIISNVSSRSFREASKFEPAVTSEIANNFHGVTGVMIVQFRSGGTYAYLLPYRVFLKLLWGKSKGKAFHENVKGKYLSVKLD